VARDTIFALVVNVIYIHMYRTISVDWPSNRLTCYGWEHY